MSKTISRTTEVKQGKTIIDGVITRLEDSGLPAWCNHYQVARVADWYVCLPTGSGAKVGSEVRIVKPYRVRVDGRWFDIQDQPSLTQEIAFRILGVLLFCLSLFGLTCFWKMGVAAWDQDWREALTWLLCIGGISWVIDAIPLHGKPGLWKVKSD